MTVPNGDDWAPGFFDEWYLRLFQDDPTRTAHEVAVLSELLPRSPAKVLDAACGHGRHAIPLALAGYRVVGVDRSPVLLARGRQAADATGVEVDFVETDLRELDLEGEFDAVINLFISWGYFEDDAENLRALTAMARSLRPGGVLVMDTIHRDAVVAEYVERDWQRLPDGGRVWVERRFDAVRGLSTVTHEFETANGERFERHHRLRLYTATDLVRMFRAAGLEPTNWYSGFSGEDFTFRSRRVLVRAEKHARPSSPQSRWAAAHDAGSGPASPPGPDRTERAAETLVEGADST